MRILPITLLLLLLTAVLSTPTERMTNSNAIQDTMTLLERTFSEAKTANTELPTAARQAGCRKFTVRRAIACLCEITRVQFANRTIPRGPGRSVVRSCAAVLGVGRKRFSNICSRLGLNISGDPRASIIGVRGTMNRCGRGASLAGLSATM